MSNRVHKAPRLALTSALHPALKGLKCQVCKDASLKHHLKFHKSGAPWVSFMLFAEPVGFGGWDGIAEILLTRPVHLPSNRRQGNALKHGIYCRGYQRFRGNLAPSVPQRWDVRIRLNDFLPVLTSCGFSSAAQFQHEIQ